MGSYRELDVWKRSIELCVDVYAATELFPKSEIYGLTSQIRRCCVSIPSNIAEGQCRQYKNEFIQFLRIAFGSGAELETQLLIAEKLGYLGKEKYETLNDTLNSIMKMLNKLINSLSLK